MAERGVIIVMPGLPRASPSAQTIEMISFSAVSGIAGSSLAEWAGEHPLYMCDPEIHAVRKAFEKARLPRGRVGDVG